MDIEKLFQGEGGYVFVSHSHLDVQGVRKIRNFLEKEGMEPILFYLRCMDGGSEQQLELLKKLIFDEIDAREFFLYVNSENAAASKWVQEELNYIRSTRPQSLVTIDLSETEETIEKKLARLVKGMRVFISSSRRDYELARSLTKKLNDKDFRVYDAEAVLSPFESWDVALSKTLTSLANEGFVMALLTESSIRSEYVKAEIRYALQKDVFIFPVVVGNELSGLIREHIPELVRRSFYVLPSNPSEEDLTKLVDEIVKMQKNLF